MCASRRVCRGAHTLIRSQIRFAENGEKKPPQQMKLIVNFTLPFAGWLTKLDLDSRHVNYKKILCEIALKMPPLLPRPIMFPFPYIKVGYQFD